MTVITALLGIGCATMGGVYFAFSFFVMEALAVLPDENGLRAMQSINRVILSSAFMPLFVGTTLGCIAVSGWTVYGWTLGGVNGTRDASVAPLLLIASLVYLMGMFLDTAAFNVPLNNRLAAVNGGAGDFWPAYVVQWTRWNHVRTLASVVAAGLFITAYFRLAR